MLKLDVIQPAAEPTADRPKPCCARADVGEYGWRCPMHPQAIASQPGPCPVCGMSLEPVGQTADAAAARARESVLLAVCAVLAGLLVIVSMAPMAGHLLPAWTGGHALARWFARTGLTGTPGNWLQLALASPIVFWGGWPILSGGFAGLRAGRPTMFSLITIGVLVAWATSVVGTLAPGIFPPAFRRADGSVEVFFESAGTIIVLVLVGQLLESRARRGTTAALRSLLDLSPPTAERLPGGETIPLAAVRVGDLLRVKPGGRIPVDGTVREGLTTCDESLLTGEPMPANRRPGDRVLGGAINGSGAIVIEATAASADSLVARIAALVREAHATRAPIEQLADRIAAAFVPAVLGVAAVTFLAWSVYGPQPRMALGLLSAVSVLVIACPCALGLATPLAMTVAIGRAARAGILVRTAEAMEQMGRVGGILFDKTGTITRGQPAIVMAASGGDTGMLTAVDVKMAGGAAVAFARQPLRDLLATVAAVETASEHGLARAFATAAAEAGLAIASATDVTAIVGRGVAGRAAGHAVLVGNAAFLRERGIEVATASGVGPRAPTEAAGATLVDVAIDGRPAGWFAIADPPRPEARDVIASLQRRGLAVGILSGDGALAARHTAAAVGIDDVAAGLSPADKATCVGTRRAALATAGPRRTLAFVGDGINDAPALATADVGIAMGSGADIAMETADVTLLSGGLHAVPRALDLAAATMHTVRQNLLLAFLYNVLAIPIAAGVLYPVVGHVTSPMLAAAAMSLSSLSVIANSLRLRLWTPRS
ncbi:MAG: copper-transporting P-type ATPase [Pirellulales bacterium]